MAIKENNKVKQLLIENCLSCPFYKISKMGSYTEYKSFHTCELRHESQIEAYNNSYMELFKRCPLPDKS